MYIRGRSKMGYLTGATTKPEETATNFATWDAENSMVMTWLVNSMNEEIGANYLGYSTAKELWDDVQNLYSVAGNQSQIYELKYYSTLKRVWQDLDVFNDHEWTSAADQSFYRRQVEINRIFKFLAGLNVEFDEVRGRIVGRNPLPT
ncbi:hypothetical protein LINPERHAP1_LOCUS1372 [Linum perenne]